MRHTIVDTSSICCSICLTERRLWPGRAGRPRELMLGPCGSKESAVCNQSHLFPVPSAGVPLVISAAVEVRVNTAPSRPVTAAPRVAYHG